MINSAIITNKEKKQALHNVLNDIYLLPRWEKIKTFIISESSFLFFKKMLYINLFRKFSSKNMLEKYSIRTDSGNILANMDLRIYKDCVYIVNLEINSTEKMQTVVEKLLQTAVEKSIYNTTNKEIFINISSDQSHKWRLKNILLNNGFEAEENQSKYEKNIFGETFKLSANSSIHWNDIIKHNPILINK